MASASSALEPTTMPAIWPPVRPSPPSLFGVPPAVALAPLAELEAALCGAEEGSRSAKVDDVVRPARVPIRAGKLCVAPAPDGKKNDGPSGGIMERPVRTPSVQTPMALVKGKVGLDGTGGMGQEDATKPVDTAELVVHGPVSPPELTTPPSDFFAEVGQLGLGELIDGDVFWAQVRAGETALEVVVHGALSVS